MKKRPLGSVSDFVVEEMPRILESQPKELVHWCGRLDSVAPVLHASEDRDLALLDLKMLEVGIVHSGLQAPSKLLELVDQFAGSEVPGLTYEDLVFVNPANDRRAFTRGEVGETEKTFYSSHTLIETCLNQVIEKVRRAIQKVEVAGIQDSLEIVENRLDLVLSVLASLYQMRPEHFSVFRKYLNSHPVRGLKGPSGAFTAGIPILEVMTRGDELPPEYFTYLTENMKYFPRAGQKMLQEVLTWSATGNTLTSLSRHAGADPVLGNMVEMIGTFLNKFRAMHYPIVPRQVPEIVHGDVAGTGGEKNPLAFLRERMRITRFSKKRRE